MDNKPIGIFDSGVGGLSIYKEIVRELPLESTIYIADSKNIPYGTKTPKEIHKLARKLVQFLLKKNVKLIVVACNTITVSSLDKLRREFPQIPIVGTVPVIKTASKSSKDKKIGILSTVRTAESQYQKNLIKKFARGNKVLNIGTDKLVPLIESGRNVDLVLKEELKPFINSQVDVLALGCTHFPLIKNKIQGILGSKVLILDSGPAIARQVRRVLTNNNILSSSKKDYIFYTTGDNTSFNKIFKSIGYNGKARKVSL